MKISENYIVICENKKETNDILKFKKENVTYKFTYWKHFCITENKYNVFCNINNAKDWFEKQNISDYKIFTFKEWEQIKKLTMKIPENLNQEQIDALTNLLKSFEKSEEKLVSGWYIYDGHIYETVNNDANDERSKMIWATKEQAEACLAMSELSQLMKKANGEWEANWKKNEYKYIIYFEDDQIVDDCVVYENTFLSFKIEEVRDEFLKENEKLILKAKQLL